MKATRNILFLIAITGLLSQTGCTIALWKETGSWDASKTPAQPNHLQVFEDPRHHDYLVLFEQISERTDSVHPRAYYLYASESKIERRKRPRFVSVRHARDLTPLPLLQSATNFPAEKPFVVAIGDYQFTLHSRNGETTSHMLPTYDDKIGQVERIALTPVAIAADATVIGAIILLEAAAHSNWSCEGP